VKRKGGIDHGTINVYNLTKHKLLLSDLTKRCQRPDVCYKHVMDNSVSICILFILFLFFIDRMKYE